MVASNAAVAIVGGETKRLLKEPVKDSNGAGDMPVRCAPTQDALPIPRGSPSVEPDRA